MLKKYIPNLLTFMNLSFGVLSIVQVMNKNYVYGAILIILAAVVDRYDGKIARMLNVSSEIGLELDSLADLVSFGVAPAFLVVFKYGANSSIIGLSIMITYILCGCYRLAKYNITSFDGVFSGVPITICGCLLALFSFINISNIFISGALMLIFAYLMVSKLKLKKR